MLIFRLPLIFIKLYFQCRAFFDFLVASDQRNPMDKLHSSKVAKLEALTVASACTSTQNYGGLYFNGKADKLMLYTSTGWSPLN
jgi:hypothetical protein